MKKKLSNIQKIGRFIKHSSPKSRDYKWEDKLSGLMAVGRNCPSGRKMEKLTCTTLQKVKWNNWITGMLRPPQEKKKINGGCKRSNPKNTKRKNRHKEEE